MLALRLAIASAFRHFSPMPFIVWIAPFIPFLALIPPSLAAMWIAHRWLRNRTAGAEVMADLAALRDELSALQQAQSETEERLDLSERMLRQLREVRRDLPTTPH